MNLWPHQERAIELVREEMRRGHRAIVVVMPTGAGKTITGGHFARLHLDKKPGGKVLWVAHREELVSQAYDALTGLGLACGVIQAVPSREVNPHRPVQVASIQTLLARGIVLPDITLMVIDEAHHAPADKWSKLAHEYISRGIWVLGLTATPARGDGRGLGDIFDAIVVPTTIKELIRDGFLVPYELKAPSRPLAPNEIAQSPVDAYLEHARARKTIVFAGNIKAANKFVDEFRAAGVRTDIVTGDMDALRRRTVLENYKEGRLEVLVNVGVLTEGFDDRPTSCVIIARPVGPVSLFLQICGRGLRTASECGKKDAILIDLHGSCRKHGEPDEDREYSLDGDGISRKGVEDTGIRFCPVCGVLVTEEGCECPARPELAAPDVAGVELVRYAKKRKETPEEKQAYFNKLMGIAHVKGYSIWQPVKKYEAIYGEKPPMEWVRPHVRASRVS